MEFGLGRTGMVALTRSSFVPIPIGAWSIPPRSGADPSSVGPRPHQPGRVEHIRQSLCSLLGNHDISYLDGT